MGEAAQKLIVSQMTMAQQLDLKLALTPRHSKYVPHMPTTKQAAFLLLDNREAFYGGAAGGGKSDALLMAALQYVDEPGYNAILFRKTYSDLALPEALMDRAHQWLQPYKDAKEVRWDDRDKRYIFPSGATVSFGYLENPNDKYRYQGAAFQFIGFDEVTQIDERSYRYMFSRLRRLAGRKVPLRVRSASNPGGVGHEWVKTRFLVEGINRGRIFIPATLHDNPFLDIDTYIQSLMELDPVERAQLLEGNWEVRHGGMMFQRHWFNVIDIAPRYMRRVRYWDLASTDPTKQKNKKGDPDYTVGFLLGEYRGNYYILDIKRFRKRPHEVELIVKQTAKLDGYGVEIWIEQEPGSSGVAILDHYIRAVLKGYTCRGNKVTGSKVSRANAASAAAEHGLIYILRKSWTSDFLDEVELFPDGGHDDQVDGFSGAFEKLSRSVGLYLPPSDVEGSDSYWGDYEYNREDFGGFGGFGGYGY